MQPCGNEERDKNIVFAATPEVRSGMRALHQASVGQKVVLLNDSECSLNFLFICLLLLLLLFFNFCIEPVVDINSTYQYTKTFHLIEIQ